VWEFYTLYLLNLNTNVASHFVHMELVACKLTPKFYATDSYLKELHYTRKLCDSVPDLLYRGCYAMFMNLQQITVFPPNTTLY